MVRAARGARRSARGWISPANYAGADAGVGVERRDRTFVALGGSQPGRLLLVPAGTVHAIGPGLALCEIQQHSDITYRLFDYGRPRELHLEKALQVASLDASDAKPRMLPIDCEYFHTELAKIDFPMEYPPGPDRFHLLVFLGGMGRIGDQQFRAGETWLVPKGADSFLIQPDEPTKFLRTWVPDSLTVAAR